ncbi:hypothetical protein O9993_02690 [Vibrio lentus]|nr:hypothetical protein [Vibrio lentus]
MYLAPDYAIMIATRAAFVYQPPITYWYLDRKLSSTRPLTKQAKHHDDRIRHPS